ncbi:hypothetical protein BGW42_006750, partial [Actinomortierella wolfii]
MTKGATAALSCIEWMKESKKKGYMVYYNEQDTVYGRDVGCGVPVAFLLTTTQEVHVLSGWLKAIRAAMKDRYSTEERPYELKPAAFITDQGSAEISAFKLAFGGLDVKLHFCNWHIYRIWIREISKRVVFKPGDTQDQKKELKSL